MRRKKKIINFLAILAVFAISLFIISQDPYYLNKDNKSNIETVD